MARVRSRSAGRSTARRVLLVMALALGIVPLIPGVAFGHHAEIVASSIDCDGVVTFTASAWLPGVADNANTPQNENHLSRTNTDIRVWYTVNNGPQITVVDGGAFNPQNNFSFGGTFQAPATGTIRVFSQAEASWANGGGAGGATTTGALTRSSNCLPNVTFSKSGPASVVEGGTIQYTIAVQNGGNATSQPITVTDDLADGFSGVQASSSVGSCNVGAGNLVTCNVGTLIGGRGASISISATVPDDDCSPIQNAASVQQGTQPAQGTNTVSTVVTGCSPTLTISKSGPSSVDEGGDITWGITVMNSGNAAAQGVAVVDTLPAGFSFVSASQGCAHDGGIVTCTIGTIGKGAQVSVSITATAPNDACGPFTNSASGTVGNDQPIAGSPATSSGTVTGCAPDIQIHKQGSVTSVEPGGQIVYTVTVSNDGNADASDVVVTDVVPSGLTIDGVTGAGCSTQNQTVTCTIGTLSPTDPDVVITIAVTATTDACPSVTNAASVSWNEGPQTTTGTTGSEQVTVAVDCTPGLHVIKSASAASVVAGGGFSYTIVVENTGTAPAFDVVVSDTIAASLSIGAVTGPGCSVDGHLVTCAVGGVDAGDSVTITIAVTSSPASCPGVSNTAHVTFENAAGQGGTADGNAVWVDVVCAPRITIEKTASTTTVVPGDALSFTIVVSNGGDAPATGVVVTDQVPAGLAIDGVEGPNCSVSGQLVTCNLGTLPPGRSAAVTISVTARAGACPGITNQAHVSSVEGAAVASDSNTVAVGVNCDADLQIVKNADVPAAGIASGDSFTYAITITNDGDAAAQGVVLADEVPAGLTIDGVDGPNCSVDGQVVTCEVGTLAAGDSVTITIAVTATDQACPVVENLATVTWSDGTAPGSADSNTVDTDIACIGGGTVTPPPDPDDDPDDPNDPNDPNDPSETTTPPGELAFTGGVAIVPLTGLALLLLLVGTGLLRIGRRRDNASER